jgi:hypothetical protein
MQNPNKKHLKNEEAITYIQSHKPPLLLILGAGDIDRLVPVIKNLYHGI